MAVAVIMPKQGQSVESCILTGWYKEVGDKVSEGDLLFVYETDKASFEEEARSEGILLARFFEEGAEVPVLVNVAVIGEEGEVVDRFRPGDSAGSDDFTEEKSVEAGIGPVPEQPGASVTGTDGSGNQQDIRQVPVRTGKPAISPRARKLAREKRVVIDSIIGSGPGGRIIERDILEEIKNGKRLTPLARKKLEGEGLTVPDEWNVPYGKITSRDLVSAQQHVHAPIQTQAGKYYTDIPLSNVRKIIAEAMHRSLQDSAQLTHHLSANASGILQLRNEVKERTKKGYAYNITLNDMVCYAVVRALKKFPAANAHFLGDRIRQFDKVNLGMAVDTERGLLVPALHNADALSLTALSTRLKEIVEASREGNISPDLLVPEAATFTVSNLGNYGVEMFTPVINLPQVAILGVNTILQRPITLDDGSFAFQPFMGLSLTYDHRAIDGGPATQFLAEIRDQVERLSPDLL